MRKWSFIIKSGYNNYLNNYVRHSFLIDDFVFYETGSDEDANLTYYFSSIHLNQFDEPKDVYENGLHLKYLFDGLSYIVHQNKNDYTPIAFGPLINNFSDESFNFNYNKAKQKFNVDFSINKTEYNYNDGFAKALHLSTKEEFVRNVLLMSSSGMDFTSLYKILDEIKYFIKGKDTLNDLGFLESNIKKFTHTANDFGVLGVESRHGRKSEAQSPSKPMKIDEAQELISKVIYVVFEKHFQIELPFYSSFYNLNEDIDCNLFDF
jgi:hypothetical protein